MSFCSMMIKASSKLVAQQTTKMTLGLPILASLLGQPRAFSAKTEQILTALMYLTTRWLIKSDYLLQLMMMGKSKSTDILNHKTVVLSLSSARVTAATSQKLDSTNLTTTSCQLVVTTSQSCNGRYTNDYLLTELISA